MSFQFSCQDDADLFMSLKGLANKNSGFFKSAKQAQFLFKQYSERFNLCHTPEQVTSMWGVPVAKDQITIDATAFTTWADYGSRGIIPVMYVFVLDKLGVVSLYKVGGRGNLRDGWGPDPKKAKLMWERAADAVCPWEFPSPEAVAAAPVKTSNWLGLPGEKVEVLLKLVRVRDLGYGQFGQMVISVLETEAGDIVNVWKSLGIQQGEVVKMKGTIKTTDDYKGIKQTTLTRVKLV